MFYPQFQCWWCWGFFFLLLSNVLISLWLESLGLLYCLPHVKTNIANLDIYYGNMLIQLAKHSTTIWTLENRSPLKEKSPHTRQRFTRQPCLTYLTIILIIKSLQSSCASSCHGQNDKKLYFKCITFCAVFFLAPLAVVSIRQIKYIAKCASIQV